MSLKTKIKVTRCHVCNAAKSRKSPTAYIYCDHCGALTDFDFQLAVSDPRSKLPGPEYTRLVKKLTPALETCVKQNDRDGHLKLQRQIYEAYVANCPAACPPRVNDPAYRAKYVEQNAQLATAGAFDDDMNAASNRQAAAMAALSWVPGGSMGQRIRPDTFWKLYETLHDVTAAGKRMVARAGLAELNPDGDTPVNEKIPLSMFVQGWLPYLADDVAAELLKKTGVEGSYVEATAVTAEAVPCGNCKADVPRLDGAKHCVCDGCGHLLKADVAVPCSSCGAKMLMPAERTAFQCPFCETEQRAMRWTMNQLTNRR